MRQQLVHVKGAVGSTKAAREREDAAYWGVRPAARRRRRVRRCGPTGPCDGPRPEVPPCVSNARAASLRRSGGQACGGHVRSDGQVDDAAAQRVGAAASLATVALRAKAERLSGSRTELRASIGLELDLLARPALQMLDEAVGPDQVHRALQQRTAVALDLPPLKSSVR